MKRLDTEKDSVSRESGGLGRPLRVPVFRNLLIADLVSDIGTFMQNVGAAWLMVSLHAGPGYVALTQTAASLPYFLLALPAGSAGDIFDRRRLVLFTEVWMMGVALILAILTIVGLTSPWLLLALTFALSAGDAFETPTCRAILPDLVSKDDLAAGIRLERHRIQSCQSDRTGGGRHSDRGCRRLYRLCRERHIVLRGNFRRRQVETTTSQADDAGRNDDGSYRRRSSLCSQFPWDTYGPTPDGDHPLLL
jgi:Transmembrane secretion effector